MLGAVMRVLVPLMGVVALVGSYASVDAKRITKAQLHAKQADAAARIRANVPRAAMPNKGTGVKNITFSNPRASGMSLRLYHCVCCMLNWRAYEEFYVDGTTIPDVDWDVGPSWSGLLPISSDPHETRKVSISINLRCTLLTKSMFRGFSSSSGSSLRDRKAVWMISSFGG